MSGLLGSPIVRRWPRGFAIAAAVCLARWPGVSGVASQRAPAASRPNIVLMFPDNLGWGEVNVYGGVRGPITPRLGRLAAEGLRLNNFNVEFSCTVSRAALLTGRYAIRTGATQASGITLWEVTVAEALQSIGYATGLSANGTSEATAPRIGTRRSSVSTSTMASRAPATRRRRLSPRARPR